MQEMSIGEAFSEKNTAHLATAEEKQMYRENVIQCAWFEARDALSEAEIMYRSQWFREHFLKSQECQELFERFIETPAVVLEKMEVLYRASLTKH